MIRLSVAAPSVLLVAFAAAAQGSTLPGAHPSSIEQQQAQYSSAMRAEVDSLLRHLAEDLKSRNPGWVSSSYADGAIITLGDGTAIARRDEIKKYFARIFEHARAGRITVQDVSEIRGGYRVDAQFLFLMNPPDADAFEFTVPVAMELHPGNQNVLLIYAQKGGDVPIITVPGGTGVRSIAVGKGDSLRVKVTNAAGIAIPNVKVAFAVTCGGGAVSPDSAQTSGEGIATTYFSVGTASKAECVEAVVALLPEVPVQFRIRATAVAP